MWYILNGTKKEPLFFQKKDQKGTKKVKIFTKKEPPAGTERRYWRKMAITNIFIFNMVQSRVEVPLDEST